MKRYFSIILALTTLFTCVFSVNGAECAHSFLRSFVSASCIEKRHTLYTCRRCGHSYKVYEDEFETPDGFYILAQSDRKGNTLTVKVEMHNNPGVIAGRVKVGYNAGTLSLRSFTNGEVWSEKDYTGSINLQNNPFSVFTEDYTTGNQCNKNNGLYFTIVFDVINPDGSYGFYITTQKSDFHSWDQETLTTAPQTPTIINIVGKSELGDHSYSESIVPPSCDKEGYTLHYCTLCKDSYKDNEIPSTGHSFEFSEILTEPTFTEKGTAKYKCSACDEWKTEDIPVLEHWKKGDLNGDKKINAVDTNLLRRIMVGKTPTLQEKDAADIDSDEVINARDAYLLRLMLGGN